MTLSIVHRGAMCLLLIGAAASAQTYSRAISFRDAYTAPGGHQIVVPLGLGPCAVHVVNSGPLDGPTHNASALGLANVAGADVTGVCNGKNDIVPDPFNPENPLVQDRWIGMEYSVACNATGEVGGIVHQMAQLSPIGHMTFTVDVVGGDAANPILSSDGDGILNPSYEIDALSSLTLESNYPIYFTVNAAAAAHYNLANGGTAAVYAKLSASSPVIVWFSYQELGLQASDQIAAFSYDSVENYVCFSLASGSPTLTTTGTGTAHILIVQANANANGSGYNGNPPTTGPGVHATPSNLKLAPVDRLSGLNILDPVAKPWGAGNWENSGPRQIDRSLLTVQQSDGGQFRHVDLSAGVDARVRLQTVTSSPFVLIGMVGIPQTSDGGFYAGIPLALNPFASESFVVALSTNLPPPHQSYPFIWAEESPTSFDIPGTGFPITLTIQTLLYDTTQYLWRSSNAVVIVWRL